MAASPLARGLKRRETGPTARLVMFGCEPAAEQDQGVADLVMCAADRVPFEKRRRGLAERAGMDLLGNRLDAPVAVELDRYADPASAGR